MAERGQPKKKIVLKGATQERAAYALGKLNAQQIDAQMIGGNTGYDVLVDEDKEEAALKALEEA
jgi:hypothetical protein